MNYNAPSQHAPSARHTFSRGFPRRVLLSVVATYAAVCAFVWLFQENFIYFPTRVYDTTPADVGLKYEDVTITAADGTTLAAWYIPFASPKGTILFCHGNAGNISDRLATIHALDALGYNVLIFDYRGFGASSGRPDEKGTYLDAQAAWKYLTQTLGEHPGRVILFGRSLGGAVAIHLAASLSETAQPAREPSPPTRAADSTSSTPAVTTTAAPAPIPGALVVESTFTSLEDIGRLHYPFLPVNLLLTYRYDSIRKILAVSCPKLFYHGADDELIPSSNGERLFAAAAEPKRFVNTPGNHNNSGFMYSDEHTDILATFLADALRPPQ